MSGNIDPISFPQEWDVVILGGGVSYPWCEVGEFKRAHEWDIKKAKGTLGATVTFVGRPPAKGSITFLLFNPGDWTTFDTFRQALLYDPTKKTVSAVDIYHPSLADIGITSVVTENIGNIVHAGQGLYKITVDFLEYYPPPKRSATSTPTGSKNTPPNPPGSPGTQPTDAPDALQQQIATLLGQAEAP